MNFEPSTAVIAVFRRLFPAYDGPITSSLTASDVMGWDSLRHAELIMDLEDALGIEIDPELAFQARNLGELLAGVTPPGAQG